MRIESPVRESYDQLVTCPHCGRQFPLTAALAEELAGHVLAGKEPALREQIARDLQAEYAKHVREMQDKLREQERALLQDSQVIRKLRADEVQLRRERRKLEDDRDALQAETERMRDEIRRQERDEAERKTQERHEAELRQRDEAHAVEIRELEEKLNRVNTQLGQVRRKSAMGSRQDLFAEELRRRFPADEITVTPRGMAGADVTQAVRLGGRDCGVILWACKRAASWSGNWIGKLADDVTRAGAAMGVTVSAELPTGMDSSGLVDGIWVTDYPRASTLAAGLREAVTTAWRHELANAGRDDTAAKVYDYIATGGFADRYAAAERALDAQLETLRKEKRYYAQSWAQREQQIEKTHANLIGMVGDLIRAGAELPATALAELPAADLAALRQTGVLALPSAPA